MSVRPIVFAIAVFAFGAPLAATAAAPARAAALPSHRMFAANPAEHAVDVFPAGVAQPKVAAKITTGIHQPGDVFVDRAGTLYVLDQSPAEVAIYPRDGMTPSKIVSLGSAYFPNYLTVTPNGTIVVLATGSNGNVNVMLEIGTNQSAAPYVVPFFRNAATGVAPDATNTIYVGKGSDVAVYPPFTTTPLTFITQAEGVGGLTFDASGDLFVGQPYAPGGGSNVSTEALPQGHVLRRTYTADAGDFVAFDSASGFLYASAYSTNLQIYNKNGRFVGLLTKYGLGFGVAVDPVVGP